MSGIFRTWIYPEGKLIRLKKEYPDFYHALSELAE